MVLKFLGLGKKSEYFLEAEPQPSNGSEPTAKVESPKTKPAPEAKAKAKTEEAKSEDAKSSASTKVAAAATEATAAAAKATEALATKVTQATKSKKATKPEAKQETAPEKVATPVVKVNTPTKPATATFASDNLLPTNTPRRRPGPSLDMFKEMARQVNTRK